MGGIRAGGQQHEEDLLGRIGNGGKGVGGEHRQGEHLGQERVLEPMGGHPAPDEDALDQVDGGLGVQPLCRGHGQILRAPR